MAFTGNLINHCMCISEYHSDSHCIHPDSCSTITEYDEQDETGQTWCCMYHRIWSQSTVYRSSIRIWSDFHDNHPRQHQPEMQQTLDGK